MYILSRTVFVVNGSGKQSSQSRLIIIFFFYSIFRGLFAHVSIALLAIYKNMKMQKCPTFKILSNPSGYRFQFIYNVTLQGCWLGIETS